MSAQKLIHCALVTEESTDAMLDLRRKQLLELTSASFVLIGMQQHFDLTSARSKSKALQVVTSVRSNILDLGHHAGILRIVHVVLVLDNLVILVKDFESLLGAVISADHAKLPRMLLSSLHLLRLIDKVDGLVVSPAMVGGRIVVSLRAQKRSADLLEAREFPAVEIAVGSNHGKRLVHLSKDYGEDPWRRHYYLAQLYEGVGIENEYVLLLDCEEVVPTSRVLDDVSVANFDTFQPSQPIVQDVMYVNLVDEASSELIPRWVHCNRDKRTGLVPHRHVFEDKVLSGQLALTSHVVP